MYFCHKFLTKMHMYTSKVCIFSFMTFRRHAHYFLCFIYQGLHHASDAQSGLCSTSPHLVDPPFWLLLSETIALYKVFRQPCLCGSEGLVNFCLSIAMHSVGQNIKSRQCVQCLASGVQCLSGVCGVDCDVICGPIFTKFGT